MPPRWPLLARARGVPLHLDAAQAWGKLPIEVEETGRGFVSLSSHKIGAPAGTGVLWLGRGYQACAVIPGQAGEGPARRDGEPARNRRDRAPQAQDARSRGMGRSAWHRCATVWRRRSERRIPGASVNGGGALRVANTTNLNFEGIEGDGMVMALDLAGYSVSAGSACSSGVIEPSHVLLAMGRSPEQAMAAIRVSLADAIPWEDLEGFVEALEKVVPRMRAAVSKEKVLVAMSGGVDSSVTAALLQSQGYDVVGVHMQLWDHGDVNVERFGGRCCSLVDSNDARRVCDKLGIPYFVINAQDVFKDKVVDYFVHEYLQHRTPNPCVECNNEIKFNYLFRKADELGCKLVATGHYAQVRQDPWPRGARICTRRSIRKKIRPTFSSA